MLFLTGNTTVAIPDAFLLSLVGFSVVFIALVALIAIIKAITAASGKKPAVATAPAPAPAAVTASPVTTAGKVEAIGSLGDVDLHTVDDATAAMLMAIVADDLKAPLNTLRFTSIRRAE